MAAAQSSYLNTAYRTLTSPVLRTQYILAQHGHAPSETDKLTDEEFITEIMEIRENIDNATTQHDVEEIRERNDGQLTVLSTCTKHFPTHALLDSANTEDI